MQPFLLRSLQAFACLFLLGCVTPESSREKRIARSLSIFESYPEDIQESLRNGDVQPGYDEDMVYFAMGSPHFIIQRNRLEKKVRVWQYFHNIQHQTVGQGYVPGNRQIDQYDTFDLDILMTSAQEQRLLAEVEFVDGKVVAVKTAP